MSAARHQSVGLAEPAGGSRAARGGRRPGRGAGARILGGLLALALGLGSLQADPPAGPGSPAPASTPAPAAEAGDVTAELTGLRSPFARERREAAQRLVARLPGVGPAVRAAWQKADEAVRVGLVDVLAVEGSEEGLRALLAAWVGGGDALAAVVRTALLHDPVATQKALAAAQAERPPLDAGPRGRPLQAIADLLVRDEVERLFLGRRSRSGGTGFYRGQYAVLLPHREAAIEVCYHILRDLALPLPGTLSTGGHRYLRPVNEVLEVWDLREMALHAIADLATPSDHRVIERLTGYYAYLCDLPSDEERGWQRGDPERNAFEDGVLSTLFRLQPERWRTLLRARIDSLWPRRLSEGVLLDRLAAANLAARAGLHAEAVEKYQQLLRWGASLSRATDCYNLACAYASWSREPGERDAADLREMALNYLTEAVDEHWRDLAWMREDGDLDPLRESPRYRALEQRLERELADLDAPR